MRNPKTVFSNTLESNYYQECLNNSKYMEGRYKITISIEYLSPQQYFEQCSKMFGINEESLKLSRISDKGKEYIKELEEIIEDPSNQFPMTYVDFVNKNQEGLHRMYALAELYGWDKVKFPVLIVTRTKEQEKEIEGERLEEGVWEALQESLKSKYLSIDEFIDELKSNINHELKENLHPQIKYTGDKVSVEINGFLFEYTDVKVKYETKEDRDKDFENWMKSFDEEWDNKEDVLK